jgi:hypothetical protein
VVAAVAIQMQPGTVAPVATATPPPAPAAVAALPVPAPALAPVPVPVTTAPIATPAAAPLAAPVVPAPAQAQPIEPPPAAPEQPEPAQPKAGTAHHAPVVVAKKGTLRVTSDPWAYVTVDDSIKDETPVAKFTLTAGRHTVRLKNGETGATLTRTVSVGAGETALVRVRSEDWQ